MSKTLSEFGRNEYSRIDQTIFLSKEFVAVWRGKGSSKKLQFLRFLKGDDVCPEEFISVYQRLVFLRDADSGGCFDFINLVFNLGTTSREFRELRQDRADCYQAISLRAS